jgi:hypothetical protein
MPTPSAHGAQRCLTPRSRRGPTAGHQARSGGTRYIFASPGLAPHRRPRLSSNVRPRSHACVVCSPFFVLVRSATFNRCGIDDIPSRTCAPTG